MRAARRIVAGLAVLGAMMTGGATAFAATPDATAVEYALVRPDATAIEYGLVQSDATAIEYGVVRPDATAIEYGL